jgi:transcriptional regulator with XRE-family HTH domain
LDIQRRNNWTGEEMATRLGINPSSYSRIATGVRLPPMNNIATRAMVAFPEIARKLKP